MLEYDINADVRRAVLSSIAATTRTVGVILDRTRDAKDSVRRLAYQVIAEKVHVRALTIAQRVRVLRQGLNDRTGLCI
jgi:condensin complex subunit 3